MATSGDQKLMTLTNRERSLGAQVLIPRKGDGGGADVADFLILQRLYSDPTDGNVALLLWTENTTNNPDGVKVKYNDRLLGTLPGLNDADLPGTNGVNITNLPAGPATFKVEAPDGSSQEATMEILDTQPHGDAQNLTCAEAGRNPADGTCAILLKWDLNPAGVEPTSWVVLVNDVPQAEIPGTSRDFTLLGVPPGTYTATLVGFLQNEDGLYRGQFIDTTCDVNCEDKPCDAPQLLSVCQTSYGADPAQNAVVARWTNGEAPYAVGINGFVDDAAVGTLAGDATSAVFSNAAPGDHKFGIEGDCGPDGKSEKSEETFSIRSATPHPNPIDGFVTCTFDDSVPASTATWVNKDPSVFIDVYVRSGPDLFFIGSLQGDATTVTVNNTAATDQLVLQFFVTVDGDCYGSNLVECGQPGNRYMPGLCNGIGDLPQITTAIFSLNFLFIGGAEPPCKKACDSNNDGDFNLTDAVFILSYLFQGGPAPPAWVDSDQNGTKDPTCVVAAPEDDCAAGHDICAQ